MKRYALDLFCGAGGVSMGLTQAGFEVLGVDKEPQPNYPFTFIQADLDSSFVRTAWFRSKPWSLIWASPPCQHFTAYKRRPDHVRPQVNLIPHVRTLLQAARRPYVIENVVGARKELRDPCLLCGSMFDLDVRRHRLFECSFPVAPLLCKHDRQTPRFAQATNRKNKRSTVEVGVWRIPLDVQQQAMGIDWMTRPELSQAIPPAYSRYLAGALLSA